MDFIPIETNIYQFFDEINDYMSTLTLKEIKNKVVESKITFSWKDYPAIQRLLDVISSILAEEYILVAKQNPDVFLKHGDAK